MSGEMRARHHKLRSMNVLHAPPIEAPTVLALNASMVSGTKELLKNLPRDYPGAETWLSGRLDDALSGRAECLVVLHSREIAGVAILTPKPLALKLSTIYVSERFRGLGLGSILMDRAIGAAASSGFDETYVTVAEHTVPLLRPLLDSRGFTCIAVERHRYGRNRHEAVFSRLEKP